MIKIKFCMLKIDIKNLYGPNAVTLHKPAFNVQIRINNCIFRGTEDGTFLALRKATAGFV